MSTPVVFNGVTYTVPTTGETNWGDQVGSLLLALGQYAAVQTSQIQASRTSTAATTTVQPTDYAVYINYAGAAAVTLPAGAAVGQVFALKDTSGAAATNNVTISAPVGQTIDGAATYVINGNYGAVAVQFIGGNKWTLLAAVQQDLRKTATPTFTGLVLSGLLTGVPVTDGTGTVQASSTTPTELSYVHGVTSSIQTQLNGKQASGSYLSGTVGVVNGGTGLTGWTAGDLVYASASTTLARLGIGTNGYVLKSNGSNPTWAHLTQSDITNLTTADTPTFAGLTITGQSGIAHFSAGVLTTSFIVDADVSSSAAIAQSKISGLVTALSGKQATLTTGTTAQYFKGDLSLGTFATDVTAAMNNTTPTFAGQTLSQASGSAQLALTRTGTSAGTVYIGSAGGDFRVGSSAGASDLFQQHPTAGPFLKGMADGTSPIAGYVGEIIESKVSTLTTAAATSTFLALTSITLTAGEWDLTSVANLYSNTTAFTSAQTAELLISTTSGGSVGSGSGTFGYDYVGIPPPTSTGQNICMTIPRKRVSISATTTYYMNVGASFTSGTPQWRGSLSARRMR